MVSKPFYTSGFLYHLATQQILLQQSDSDSSPLPYWRMFGDFGREREDAQTAFRRIIYEQMGLRFETKYLFPVYDYDYNTHNIIHYVFYAEVPKLYTFPLLTAGNFTWFTFKQITKLHLGSQAKQDIVVSERVINAQARSKEPLILQHPGQHPNLYH